MDTIRGFELVGDMDDEAIAEAAGSASCELLDARSLDDVPPRYLAAVQRGLRSADGPARRVALLVPLSAWLRFGECNMPAHHTLRLFHPAQFDSFAVHQWIRFAREPEQDVEPLIRDAGDYLTGPQAPLMLRRAASLIRHERWELEDRATTLGRLLLAARPHVSLADRAWLEAEVRMLLDHASVVEPQLPPAVHTAIVATVERIVRRQRPTGAPPEPWYAWLAVALVRYRAGQLAFLRRHASGVFAEEDVGNSSARIVTKKEIRDAERVGWAGMMVSATAEDGTGAHGIVDRRWFSPAWFAHLVGRTRDRSHVSRRLWRWLPSERALIGFALQFLRQIGGEIIVDSEHAHWGALPPDLEAVVPLISGDDRQLVVMDQEDYFETAFVDAHCGDPETAPSLAAGLADTHANHRAWVEGTIARGELRIVAALPALYTGETLTSLCSLVLTSRARDPSAVSAVVEVLHGNDATSPDELATIAKDLTSDADLFEIAFPYLVKHRIHPDGLARRLRLLCGIDGSGSAAWSLEPPRDPSVLRFALALEPEAGRALARSYLSSHDEDHVMHASLELASIGSAWALEILRDARATAYHPDCIEAELVGAETSIVQVDSDGRDRNAERRAFGRMFIRESLDDELLAALQSGRGLLFH